MRWRSHSRCWRERKPWTACSLVFKERSPHEARGRGWHDRLRCNRMTLRVRRTFEADRLRSILVRGPNWLGDAVLSLPILANLRRSFPAARISLLVRPWVRDLFQASPFIDDLLVI